MGSWFWLNFPLALLFFCGWTIVPLWLVLTHWRREIDAKHAEIAVAEVVIDQWAASVANEAAVSVPYEAIAD